MEMEPNHMVISRRYRGWEGDICHGHMAMSWRKDITESVSQMATY